MIAELKADLSAYALSLGFERFGVTAAETLPDHKSFLQEWLAQGYEGDMAYMRRDPERRADPKAHLPGARSVIVMAMRYEEVGTWGRGVVGSLTSLRPNVPTSP